MSVVFPGSMEGDLLSLRQFARGFGLDHADLEGLPTIPWAEVLLEAQRLLLDEAGGGTIFLGPGRYLIIGTAEVLRIDPRITLWFSPGAVIDPWRPPAGDFPRGVPSAPQTRPEAVLEIAGAVRAEPHMIFMPETSDAFPPPGGRPGSSRGPVIFTGSGVEVVHPEWWGAGHLDAAGVPLDSDAILAALRAAWTHRWDAAFGGRPLPALKVVMPGRYALARPVFNVPFNTSSPHPDIVSIEGRAAGPGVATVFATDDFPLGEFLLEIRDAPGFHIDNVAFDGRGRAYGCLGVSPGAIDVDAPPKTGPLRPIASRIRGCTFRGGRWIDLVISAGAPPEGVPRVQIETSWFQPVDSTAAISLLARGPAMFAIDQCLFEGETNAMVRIEGGTVEIGGSRFHNRKPWTAPIKGEFRIGGVDRLVLESVPRGGVDILLNVSEGASASLAATHCESLSWQFLACNDERPVEVRSCVLTSVVHRNENRRQPDHPHPPSVFWNPRSDANLSLLACQFLAATPLPGEAPRQQSTIVVGDTFRGKVIDLGTIDGPVPVELRDSSGRPANSVLLSVERSRS